jgi:L-xylulose reductase
MNSIYSLFNVNVKAAINITQIIATGMKNRGSGGSIVNVSSVAGIMGLEDHTVYGATKASLDIMTKIWALELGPFNIRVNSVNPTVTWTDMTAANWNDPIIINRHLKKHPLNRFGKPEDVANAIIYLLSDKSDMITGTVLPIDAGLTSSK